jgi:hypothetical protein
MRSRRWSRSAKRAGAVPCGRIRQAISARFDGERLGVRAKIMDSHVTHCRGCQQYREGIAALNRQPDLQTSRRVPLGLKERLAVELPHAMDPTRRVYPWFSQTLRWDLPWRRGVRWLAALAPATIVVAVLPLGALSSPHVRPAPASTPCTIYLRSVEGRFVSGGALSVMSKSRLPG